MATVGIFQCAAVAQQQEAYHFADTRIIVGDWTFVPIYTGDKALSPDVVGFFTYADEFTRTGDNLSAVWYQYDQGAWNASSWNTVDLQEAVKSVVLTLNIDNTLWEYDGATLFEGTPESPKAFSNGVIATDPLASAVDTASDPVPLVDFLITLGYAAADVPIIGDQGCNREELLNDIASTAGGYLTSGDETVAFLPADLCASAGIPTGPEPPKTPATAPVNPPQHVVIPVNGPLPGTGWITGGWPVFGTPPANDWSCSILGRAASGYTCSCSRQQQWGRWETKNGRSLWCVVVETQVCQSETSSTRPATCSRTAPPSFTCGSSYNQ